MGAPSLAYPGRPPEQLLPPDPATRVRVREGRLPAPARVRYVRRRTWLGDLWRAVWDAADHSPVAVAYQGLCLSVMVAVGLFVAAQVLTAGA